MYEVAQLKAVTSLGQKICCKRNVSTPLRIQETWQAGAELTRLSKKSPAEPPCVKANFHCAESRF
jgi:hypothetical protein